MTVKINRSGTPATQISFADSPLLTFPDSDWAIAVGVVFNGETGTTTSAYQTLWRTGNSGEAGGIVAIWDPFSSGNSTAGKFYFQINGSTNSRCVSSVVEAGKAYIIGLQRSGGAITSKLIPVMTTAPIDGTAVFTSTAQASASAYDGTQGLIFGVHNVSSRRFDQSITRAFCINKALTDIQWAQLAYGKEITEFGTPTWYLRMNDVSDIVDSGPNALPVTTSGALSTGPEPGFGYSSLPTSPVINGKPVISGAPVVGATTSYVAAPVTGNPSPAITQQWSVDGVDVNGAIGASYTPVAGDAGKLLRVKQTAQNGSGVTSATSDPVMVSSGAVGLTADAIPAEKIFQRINGQATVPMSGTYTGTAPSVIECQLYAPDGVTVVVPWFNVFATIGSGTWSATPSVIAPTNGLKYRRSLRMKNSAGSVIFTLSQVEANRFGVGDIIICMGSSSVAAWFDTKSGTGIVVDQNSTSTMDGNTGVWQNFGTDGRAGQMSEYIAQRLGVPVAMLNVALGGSSLFDWSNPSSSLMARFNTALAFAGGKLGGVFLSAGSNDVTGASSAPTVQSHLDKLNGVRDNVRASTGQSDLPVLLSGINRRASALMPQVDNARTAENQFGDQPNCYHTQTLDFELSSDDVHLTGPGFVASCERNRYVWAEARLGTYRRGPKLLSKIYNGSKVQITVQHRNGSNITPSSNITGFVTTDGSGTANLVSSERLDATQILLTYDRVLSNPTVTYLSGAAPEVGTPVYDNGTVPLPMTMDAYTATNQGTISENSGPLLSNATASATGSTTATGSVTTDQASGTLYKYVSANVSEPATMVKTNGLAATVEMSGVQNVSFTGLPANTKLYAHYLHTNSAGLDSAVLSSGQFQTAQAADTTPPTITGASVANISPSTVALTSSEPLDTGFVPSAGAFTVQGHTVLSVSVTSSVINLDVTPAFIGGETPRTVSYTKPASNGTRDAAGNQMESFSNQAIANFATGGGSTSRTISLVLGNENGLLGNLSNIKVAVFAEATPDLYNSPVFKASNETTDANGLMVITFDSSIVAGSNVGIVVQMSDGRNLARTVTVM